MNTAMITESLNKVREQNPLVVNITNYVVMNNTANALLAVGASPIMAHSRLEMSEMMSFAGALVINIGTLDSPWIERMSFAIEEANKHNKIVVLDPVGCGATNLRTQTSREFAKAADRLIIRANASEVIAMAGELSNSRGVDAMDSSSSAVNAAKQLVDTYQCNVVISGETDYIVSKETTVALDNGHSLMPKVTGMGCSHTALTGAFAAVGETTGLAAAAVLGVAGEIAAETGKGPGSFQMSLLDALYSIREQDITKRLALSI